MVTCLVHFSEHELNHVNESAFETLTFQSKAQTHVRHTAQFMLVLGTQAERCWPCWAAPAVVCISASLRSHVCSSNHVNSLFCTTSSMNCHAAISHFFIINSFVSSFLRESIKLPRKCNQRQREEHSRINWGDVFSLKTRNHKRSRKMFSDHWPPAQTLIQWIRFFFVGPPFAAYPLWDQLSWTESAATYKRLKRFIFKHINRVTEWQLVTWSVFAAFQPLSKGGLEYLTSCWATRKH